MCGISLQKKSHSSTLTNFENVEIIKSIWSLSPLRCYPMPVNLLDYAASSTQHVGCARQLFTYVDLSRAFCSAHVIEQDRALLCDSYLTEFGVCEKPCDHRLSALSTRAMLVLFTSSVLLKDHAVVPASEVTFYVFAAVRFALRSYRSWLLRLPCLCREGTFASQTKSASRETLEN